MSLIYNDKTANSIAHFNAYYITCILYNQESKGSWQLDLKLPMQSVPIPTKVVSSNHAYWEVYSMQHYVIKFASDLRQVGCFLHQSINWPPRYDWNIVASGVKHHNFNCITKKQRNIFQHKINYYCLCMRWISRIVHRNAELLEEWNIYL